MVAVELAAARAEVVEWMGWLSDVARGGESGFRTRLIFVAWAVDHVFSVVAHLRDTFRQPFPPHVGDRPSFIGLLHARPSRHHG